MDDKTRFIITEIVSGIVHDINNALSLLNLRVENVEDLVENPDQESLKKAHAELEDSVDKLSEVLKRLTHPFKRSSVDHTTEVDLNEFCNLLLGSIEHIAHVRGVDIKNEVDGGVSLSLEMPKSLYHAVFSIMEFLSTKEVSNQKTVVRLRNEGKKLELVDDSGNVLLTV